MNSITKRFADELIAEKEMRDAYLAAQTRTFLAGQIRTIRNEREWSQSELAEKLGKQQNAVSRMEDRSYGKFSLQTLYELAAAFDCGLVIQFVPYAEFIKRTSDMSPSALTVPSFTRESLAPLYRGVTQYIGLGAAVNTPASGMERYVTGANAAPPASNNLSGGPREYSVLVSALTNAVSGFVMSDVEGGELLTFSYSPAADNAEENFISGGNGYLTSATSATRAVA